MPLVSIAVAAYQVEKYLERCIKSLLAQTYENLEILLVDDGSKDRTADICDQYAAMDSRIRVIHKVNEGLAEVRNVSLAEVKGEYFLFVDSDDYVHPDFVKTTVACAQRHEADVVIMDFEEIEEATGRIDYWSMDMPREKVFSVKERPELLFTTPGAWNKLYRTAFFRSTGIKYPKGRNYEDLTVAAPLLLEAERIVYVDSPPLYKYIIREGSIMRSNNFEKSYRERKAAIEEILAYFQDKGSFQQYCVELEYLSFLHGYFVPIKEILYYDAKSPYLQKFLQFVPELFPNAAQNKYIQKTFSKNDRIIFWLMERKLYKMIVLLSRLRFQKDLLTKKQRKE